MSLIATGDLFAVSNIHQSDANGELLPLISIQSYVPDGGLEFAQQGLVFSQFAGGHNALASEVVTELFQKSADLKTQVADAKKQIEHFYARFFTNFEHSLDTLDGDNKAEEVSDASSEQTVELITNKLFYFRARKRESSHVMFMSNQDENQALPSVYDVYTSSGNVILSINRIQQPNEIDDKKTDGAVPQNAEDGSLTDGLIKACIIKTINDLTREGMDLLLPRNMGVTGTPPEVK